MKKKLLALILSVAVVASIAAAGTLAYLTAQTGPVENTFTVGDITLDLKEHELKDDGALNLEKEVTENEYTRVLPGQTLPKDPFVTVEKGSEDCYLYAFVYNGVNDIVAGAATPNVDITKWTEVKSEKNGTLYRWNETVEYDAENDFKATVFSTVEFNKDLDEEDMDALSEAGSAARIVIQAYAHQAEGVDVETADAAAAEIFGALTVEIF